MIFESELSGFLIWAEFWFGSVSYLPLLGKPNFCFILISQKPFACCWKFIFWLLSMPDILDLHNSLPDDLNCCGPYGTISLILYWLSWLSMDCCPASCILQYDGEEECKIYGKILPVTIAGHMARNWCFCMENYWFDWLIYFVLSSSRIRVGHMAHTRLG